MGMSVQKMRLNFLSHPYCGFRIGRHGAVACCHSAISRIKEPLKTLP